MGNLAYASLPPELDKENVHIDILFDNIRSSEPPSAANIRIGVSALDGTGKYHFFGLSRNLSASHLQEVRVDDVLEGSITPDIAWDRMRSILRRCENSHRHLRERFLWVDRVCIVSYKTTTRSGKLT